MKIAQYQEHCLDGSYYNVVERTDSQGLKLYKITYMNFNFGGIIISIFLLLGIIGLIYLLIKYIFI